MTYFIKIVFPRQIFIQDNAWIFYTTSSFNRIFVEKRLVVSLDIFSNTSGNQGELERTKTTKNFC